MGKKEVERLKTTLTTHMSNIHETLQILDQTPVSSLQKNTWADVLNMSDQLSKQATTAGMLFTGEKTELKGLEENMKAYFNVLQGLVLLAYGSTVGAGPTLSSFVHASIKQAVDSSFMLWRGCVSSYGSSSKEQNQSVPKLVGIVWDACSALKKTPETNVVAVGRAMTQVAVSMKDVLRELKELEVCSSDPTSEVSDGIAEAGSTYQDDATSDVGDEDEFGKDLSPEEMKTAQLAIEVVSKALVFIKELIRAITGLLKKENLNDENECVDSLEKLLKFCRSVGSQVDELGACLYPPQENVAIAAACKEMLDLTAEVAKQLRILNGITEAFSEGCKALENSLGTLKLEISEPVDADGVPQSSSGVDIVSEMQKLAV